MTPSVHREGNVLDGKVLIVGDSTDAHVHAVRRELRQLCAEVCLVDRAAPDEEDTCTFAVGWSSPEGSPHLSIGRERLQPEEIGAVWWREKPRSSDLVQGSSARAFAQREWKRALEGLGHLAPGARWMNPRTAAFRSRSKVTQLGAATLSGLRTPPTLVTNDADQVRRFVDDAPGDVVYKSLSWFFDPPNWTIFTSRVDPRDLADRSTDSAIVVAPGIFQHRVPKAYEVRVTVVGDEIFPVGIDSQAHERAQLDWRRAQLELDYWTVELPQDVAFGIRALMTQLDLVFAAHDFIVTPTGEYVFLEVNPAGQWLWLEERTGLPISAAVARWLLHGEKAQDLERVDLAEGGGA